MRRTLAEENNVVPVDATDKVKELGAEQGLKKAKSEAGAAGLSPDEMSAVVNGSALKEGKHLTKKQIKEAKIANLKKNSIRFSKRDLK